MFIQVEFCDMLLWRTPRGHAFQTVFRFYNRNTIVPIDIVGIEELRPCYETDIFYFILSCGSCGCKPDFQMRLVSIFLNTAHLLQRPFLTSNKYGLASTALHIKPFGYSETMFYFV